MNNFFSHYILINENNKNYNLSLEKYLRTPADGLLVIFGAFNYMDKKKNSPNFPNLGCLYMNLPIEIIKEIDYTTMSCWYIEYKKRLGNINLLYPVKHKYQSFIEMGEISNE